MPTLQRALGFLGAFLCASCGLVMLFTLFHTVWYSLAEGLNGRVPEEPPLDVAQVVPIALACLIGGVLLLVGKFVWELLMPPDGPNLFAGEPLSEDALHALLDGQAETGFSLAALERLAELPDLERVHAVAALAYIRQVQPTLDAALVAGEAWIDIGPDAHPLDDAVHRTSQLATRLEERVYRLPSPPVEQG